MPGADCVLFDFQPVSSLCPGVGHIVYVDNGVCLSTEPGVAEETRVLAQKALEAHGLPVHDIVHECHEIES